MTFTAETTPAETFSTTLERDHRRYRALVYCFVAASLLFGVVVGVVLRDDGRIVPIATSAQGTAGGPAVTNAPAGVSTAKGGADSSGVPGTGTAAGVAAGTAAGVDPGAPATAATGAPSLAPGEEIVVGSVVTETGPVSFPQVAAALRAYFADLNARGGINGHPVKLELFDDGLDTNRSRQAFKQLASNPKVLAVVGSFAPLGEPAGIAELDKAGIPVITASGLAPTSFDAKVAYFLTSTLENYGRVACGEALRRGQKRVALVYVNSEQIAPIISAYSDCITQQGGAVLDESVQLGQPDYTATALRIGQFHADVIFHEMAQSATVQLWQAMDRQGVVAANQLVPGSDIDLIRNYTGRAGAVVTIQTNVVPPHVDLPAIATIKSALAKYQPGVDATSLAVDKWIGAELFTLVATRAGEDLTRQRILDEMSRVASFDANGLVPPITYGPDQRTTEGLFFFFDRVNGQWGPVSDPRGPP
jgi:branched-chain amino acid transport system substrate-binding protein